jgi:hypothetical protein
VMGTVSGDGRRETEAPPEPGPSTGSDAGV